MAMGLNLTLLVEGVGDTGKTGSTMTSENVSKNAICDFSVMVYQFATQRAEVEQIINMAR